MAVQQNRKTRSKRGMRRAHDAIGGPTLTVDETSGETRLRHHVSLSRKEGSGHRRRRVIVFVRLRLSLSRPGVTVCWHALAGSGTLRGGRRRLRRGQ
mgnify:CR=1 FL=1